MRQKAIIFSASFEDLLIFQYSNGRMLLQPESVKRVKLLLNSSAFLFFPYKIFMDKLHPKQIIIKKHETKGKYNEKCINLIF